MGASLRFFNRHALSSAKGIVDWQVNGVARNNARVVGCNCFLLPQAVPTGNCTMSQQPHRKDVGEISPPHLSRRDLVCRYSSQFLNCLLQQIVGQMIEPLDDGHLHGGAQNTAGLTG